MPKVIKKFFSWFIKEYGARVFWTLTGGGIMTSLFSLWSWIQGQYPLTIWLLFLTTILVIFVLIILFDFVLDLFKKYSSDLGQFRSFLKKEIKKGMKILDENKEACEKPGDTAKEMADCIEKYKKWRRLNVKKIERALDASTRMTSPIEEIEYIKLSTNLSSDIKSLISATEYPRVSLKKDFTPEILEG